jgi:AcrR family transcriptional regulator
MVSDVLDLVAKSRKSRADETGRRIFAAARALFEEQGYAETTIDAIARRAGVAKGTFFVHFATKDAVITELVGIQTRKALEARDAAIADGPLAALRATVMTLGSQAGASRRLSRAVLAATLEKQAVGDATGKLFDGVLQQMIADARAAGVADARMLAHTLMTSYLGAVLNFTTTPRTPPLTELLAPLVEEKLHATQIARPARRARRLRLHHRQP